MQEQLEGSLIIIGLMKIYRFFLWKFVHFEKSVLDGIFAHITRNAHYHLMPLWSVIITRTLIIKFRPKTRYQTVGLMKWLHHKCNWVAQFSVKEFLASTRGTQKTPQTVRWPCKLGHFLKAQGKFIFSFLCTLFLHIFDT